MRKRPTEYKKIHHWLKQKYGRAFRCDKIKCLRTCRIFEWSLIHGRKHQYKKENYRQLCRSCHRKYDITKAERELFSQRAKKLYSGLGNPMYGVHRFGKDNPMYGRKHSAKTKKLMSQIKKLKQ